MSKKLQKYIERQPDYPEGFQFKTAILVTDSKGYTLRNSCIDNEFPIESWCKVGATTKELVDLINSRITKAIHRHHQIIIYLWGGTCDITTKKGKFIHLRHKHKTVTNIIKEFRRAIEIVNQHPGAEIKFVDCPILSITKWNKHKHHHKPELFKTDDFVATKQVQDLNRKIWDLNKELNTTSVRISKYYFRGRKRRGGQTRKSVNLSINNKDGIHPGRLLSLVITKHLLLDTYKECFNIISQEDIVQITVEQEELITLF